MTDDEKSPPAPSLRDQLGKFSRPMYDPYDAQTGDGLTRPEPTAAELANETSAPGRKADHEYGVLYNADHETLDDGLCRQVRLHARALADAGLVVKLQSIAHVVRHGDMTWPMAGEDVLAAEVVQQVRPLKRVSIEKPLIVLRQLVLSDPQVLRRILVPGHLAESKGATERLLARTIVYTPWERSTISPEIASMLKRCGQVWVQCQDNLEAFATRIPKEKLCIVPNAYDPNALVCSPPPEVPRGRRYYNIGKWEPRKGQHALLGAFFMAHRPTDEATLTIKTREFGNWDGYPSYRTSLYQWLQDSRVRNNGWTHENVESRVRVMTSVVSDELIAKLHHLNNIYVSAGHAEGWDYPAFDAVSAGNRLVAVGYGGPRDFRRYEDVLLARPLRFTAAHPGYGWEPEAKWASYDVEQLSQLMLRAELPERRAHPREALRVFSAESVGKLMRTLVVSLAREVDPEGAKKLEARK